MADAVDYRLIERADGPPLFVTLRRLTADERARIPFDSKTTMDEAMQAIAPYVIDWSFEAEDVNGVRRSVPVPSRAPAEWSLSDGWEVLELLDADAAVKLVALLKYPEKVG